MNFPYSHYLLDGLALRLAGMCISAGIRPTSITFGNFILLLAALGVLVVGGGFTWSFLVAGLLLHGVMVLDNVDGHVARYTGQTSKLGAFADSFVTWFQQMALPLCVGYALTIATPEGWVVHTGWALPGWIWLAAGSARSVGYLLTVVVTETGKQLLGVGNYDARVNRVGGLMALKGAVEAEALLLMLASPFNMVGLLHLGYVVLHLLILGLVLVKNLSDLHRRDASQSGP